MNIVVLAGGYSSERDVSFVSGASIANALTRKSHKVILVDSFMGIDTVKPTFEDNYKNLAKSKYEYTIPKTEIDLSKLDNNTNNLIGKNTIELCKQADVVFNALHGGIGEDGRLPALLDIYNIKYTGTGYLGSIVSMDKLLSKQVMDSYNILSAPWAIWDGENKMGYPCVVKPANGGSSCGVSIARNQKELQLAIEYAAGYEKRIVIEKYIKGREFSCGVLGDRALPAIEIIPKAEFFDYESKYQTGGAQEICPADIPKHLDKTMQEIALKVHKKLELGTYSRSDFIVDEKGDVYCLEANSLPGMTPASLLPKEAKAVGIEYDDLCEMIVKLALE